ncbi:MAG: hypothetical protein AAGF77_05325, partial [Bacteroidota bacterium]
MKVIRNNDGPKVSEVIVEMVNLVDSELPEDLSFEDVLDLAKQAWNLADIENPETVILKDSLYSEQLLKMIALKNKLQPENELMITDLYLEDDRVVV